MTDLPLHPMIVHLPLALAVLVPLLALTLLVAWRRKWLPPGVWVLAVIAQVLLFASAGLALQTGEAEEERAEAFAAEAAIEAHEEAAELFLWAAGAVVIVMALPFLVPRRGRFAVASLATAATLATFALGLRVGHAGGELVHGARADHASSGIAQEDDDD